MQFKKILLYSVISFYLLITYGCGKISTNFLEYYNLFFNNINNPQFRDNKLPNLINTETNYNKRNFIFTGTLNITKNGSLSFKDNSHLVIKDSTINNDSKKPIIFDKSTLTGSKTTINSEVLLKDSILTYVDGYIKHLEIQGTTNIAVKNTKLDTLKFKNLGATDSKIGVGFNNLTAKNVSIDIVSINNEEDNKKNVKRIYNMKDTNIEHLDIKGYINIDPSKDKPKLPNLDNSLTDIYKNKDTLNTTFSFNGGNINKVTYTDPNVKTLVKLPKNTPGVFNFKDTTIENIEVSYNLLRNLGFNGVTVTYFELKDIQNAIYHLSYDDKEDPNKPKVPEFNNLQLIGGGVSYFEIFNLNNAQLLKIGGEVKLTAYNAPLSSLYIKELRNYENTELSLYNIKEINFGNYGFIPPMPQVGPPGGTNPVININYLHRVTTLGIYDNTIKFTWALEKNQHSKQDQYLSIYNLSNLNLNNSLIDVTETNKLTKPVRPANITNDPRKEFDPYDLNFTYEGSMSAFGTIFNFYNSGAIKNSKQYNSKTGRPTENYVPLRIKVKGNSFTVANDMLSNLEMQLNGERNLFTLESNRYEKDYLFHTNYNFAYLDPKDGNQKPNPTKLQYNYWEVNELQRVEQNWYTFKCDMVIVDKGSKEYNYYKKVKNGNKDYATTWFTYWQPYKVDKDGNPAKDGNPGKDHKYGDNKAWEQGTDGTYKDKDGQIKHHGGFPCEFGNKIQVENVKVTMLKPLNNLTVLEVVGKGEVDFYDMDTKYLKPQKNPNTGKETRPQWITILRMRGGILRLAKLPLVVDKLQVYSYRNYNYNTFRPVFEVKDGQKSTNVLDNQKLIVNKLADFNHNYLKVDLYFNDYFIGLNQKVTLNVLELGEYKEKVKDHKDKDKEIIKKGEIKNLEGIKFDQGILFDTNYYWKDNKLYVEITRTKNFSHFIKNIDTTITHVLDKILEKYSLTVDKDGKFQKLEHHKDLNKDTVFLINALFKAQSKQELEDYFASLRPINNETLFLTTTFSTEKLLDSVKNSNNYTYESNKGKLTFWANSSVGNSTISNHGDLLGADINNQTLVAGTSTKINKFKIGTFIGYAHNKFNSAYNNGEAPQYGGGVYTDINVGNGYFIKMSGIATSVKFKGHREHYFMNTNTNFKFSGIDAGGSVNLGKTFVTTGGFITTYASANIGYLKVDSYKENGASSATIDVKGFELPYYFTSIGVEYAKQIDISFTDSSVIVPKIGIAYKYRYYNLADTEFQFNKINSTDTMMYTCNNYNNQSLIVNTGVNFLINYHSSITSNFSAELINQITSYNFYIGYKYSF